MRRVTVIRALVALVLAAGLTPAAQGAAGAASTPARPARVSVVSTTQDSVRLAPARRVLASAEARTVVVLGDSVGNDPGEWVSMWAGNLATNRYVFVHHFDWKAERYDSDVEVHPPSEDVGAEPIVVWNFGWPGGTPQRALEHLKVGVPVKPDLAVVSFGHNVAPSRVQSQYAGLHAGLRARFGSVPVVTTLAHMTPVPRAGQAEARVVLLRWLRARGLPFVDERRVFDGLADPEDAFWDAVHPNVLGYRAIAEHVTAALTPGAVSPRGCTRPSTSAARASVGRFTARVAGSARRHSSTVRVTDTCGKPLAHAWVDLTFVLPGGRRGPTVSTQTDRRGIAPVSLLLGRGVTGTVVGSATDGTTTVAVPRVVVPAAR